MSVVVCSLFIATSTNAAFRISVSMTSSPPRGGALTLLRVRYPKVAEIGFEPICPEEVAFTER